LRIEKYGKTYETADIQKHWQIRVGIILGVGISLINYLKLYSQIPVLLEAPFDPLRRQMNSVLLTVDLTKAVVDEAIERSDSVIIAYRMYLSFNM